MIRFVPVPKTAHANILFTEFTDNDALLAALRMSLEHGRIMIQVHDNRRTAAFLSFFENGNVAVWPKKLFTPEDTGHLQQFFSDMLGTLSMRLFRTIVGENEELTLQALVSAGWQQDGTWREVTRTQTGEYIDGAILTFPSHREEADYVVSYGNQAEAEGEPDADVHADGAIAAGDHGALSAAVDVRPPAEPGDELRQLPGGDTEQRGANGTGLRGDEHSRRGRATSGGEPDSGELCFARYWP